MTIRKIGGIIVIQYTNEKYIGIFPSQIVAFLK